MSEITFESLASLVQKLAVPPKSRTDPSKPISPERIFVSWLAHQPQPLALGMGKRLFRLLFPHEGARRRYGLKETLLSRELSRVLGVPRCELDKWGRVDEEAEGDGEGCLGLAVMAAMTDRSVTGVKSTITLQQVDAHLDALASHSAYSALSQAAPYLKPQTSVLTSLYRDASLSPYALAFLTQIILRDLRPLLSPLPRLPVRNPTAMLRLKSTAGPAQLELGAALKVWSEQAWGMYMGGQGNLDWCLDAVELSTGKGEAQGNGGTVVGVNVQVPKCRKGRSVEDALSEFTGSRFADAADLVWAETKYDGYRIILAALGLPIPDNLPIHSSLPARAQSAERPARQMRSSIILEAEVVPCNEGQREGGRGPGIEEFWRLDAAGVTVLPGAAYTAGTINIRRSDRHLCLAFFDILHLDGRSLLLRPYAERRQALEFAIRPLPGFAFLAERTPVYLNHGRRAALDTLQHAFNLSAINREEGLVLKSDLSPYPSVPPSVLYNSAAPSSNGQKQNHRWVKLKRDYIPNLGDCVDLVILGAGWDMDRARELRVDTSVITTFYLGVLVNQDKVKARAEAPHFEILFRVSYGPSRDELEGYNANIRGRRWGSRVYDRDDPFKRRLLGMSWTYRIPKSMVAPSVLFDVPMCCEVMGAGFQKVPWCNLYELRWPRLQKIYEPRERPWTRALTGPDLLHTAYLALGYSTSTSTSPPHPVSSPENDSIRALWRNASKSAIDIAESLPPPASPRNYRGITSGRPGSGSGSLGKLQRNQSAPDLADLADLREIAKCSPPTPQRAGEEEARQPLITVSGTRLQGAINRDTLRDDEMTGFEDDSVRDEVRTPRSSPRKRAGLSSPLFSLSPNKRHLAEAKLSSGVRGPPQDGRACVRSGQQSGGSFDKVEGHVAMSKQSERPGGKEEEIDNEKEADTDALDSPMELGPRHGNPIVPRLDYCPAARVERSDNAGAGPGKRVKRRRIAKPLSLRARIMLALRQ